MAAITVEQALELAAMHHQWRQWDAAEAMCRRILAVQPHHAGAWHRLGVVALDRGRSGEAAELLAKAVVLAPAAAHYHCDLGLSFRLSGRLEEAIVSLRQAIHLQPGLAEAHLNLGETLTRVGRPAEAITSCREAVLLWPKHVLAHNNLGNALKELGRCEEAIACYQRALELDPTSLESYTNLGSVLLKIGRPHDAIANYNRACVLSPDVAEVHCNLGAAHTQTHQFEQALRCYRRAIALQPDLASAHSNLALLLLLLGRYHEGWRELEWYLHSGRVSHSRPAFSARQWDGSAAPGQTILVHAGHGFGDTLQFVRYLPLVKQRSGARRVIFQCPRELAGLLANGDWQAEVFTNNGDDGSTARPMFDQQAPLLGLPLALRVEQPLTINGPYLRANPQLREAWRARMPRASGLRVGLVWKGNPAHTNDRNRSINGQRFLPLIQITGVTCYNLQLPPGGGTHEPLPTAGLVDLIAGIRDFADTAAFLSELDLVITVDTATAHLAGALGRPVWTLLPLVPDWRWGLEREDTTWYPTMRLFRQKTAGDWDEVVKRVAEELRTLASEARASALSTDA